ncbi:MAG: hypothetical protein ABIJ81_02865 [Patescibacteria group bacterium]
MPMYFFILGRQPEFSVVEAWQVAQSLGLKFTNIALTKDFWIVEAKSLDLLKLQQTLAGMVKLGEVLAGVNNKEQLITAAVKKIIKPAKRLLFGFSWYGQEPRLMKQLGLELKREYKTDGRVRFVVSREKVLSSVTVQKNHLLPPSGWEIIFLPVEDKVQIGRTITVQPFADYSERDYERPSRELREGMLPPKLARTMVNLAGGSGLKSLLDPFCGSGTVLQEAALLGVPQLVGSDNQEAAITRTKQNWQWLVRRRGVKAQLQLFTVGLEQLSSKINNRKFASVVSEPFLGPPLSGKETSKQLAAIYLSLTQDYTRWVGYLANLLASNGRLVMVWPVLVEGSNFNFLPLIEALDQAGLKFIEAVPPFLPSSWLTERGTLLYYRRGQKIAREIVVLEKK